MLKLFYRNHRENHGRRTANRMRKSQSFSVNRLLGNQSEEQTKHDAHICRPKSLISRHVRTAPCTPVDEYRTFCPDPELPNNLDTSTSSPQKKSNKSLDGGSLKQTHKSSPKMKKSRNEKFHKLFKDIPAAEHVLNAYSCAYIGDILLQGYLYISPNYICFYSKILGHEKQIEIPVCKVLNITRERTAFIIPNAVGIVTAKDKYVFGSLMSRDNTYKLMMSVWITSQNKEAETATQNGPTNTVSVNTMNENPGETDIKTADASFKEDQSELNNGDESSDSDGSSACPECGVVQGSKDSLCTHQAENNNSDAVGNKMPREKTGVPVGIGTGSHTGVANSGSSTTSTPHKTTLTEPSESKPSWTNSPQYVLHCGSPKKKSVASIKKLVRSMPRIHLILVICAILFTFLLLSALLMAYKIVSLQAQLDSGTMGSIDSQTCPGHLYGNVYSLQSHTHAATVERFHSVIKANIQLLDQIQHSLLDLQKSMLFQKSCATAEKTVDS